MTAAFYRGLALCTLFLHISFLVFLFVGGLCFQFLPWTVWWHLLAVAYAVIISVLVLPCPLTALEKAFDRRAGRPPYDGDCVAHYLWSRLPVAGNEPWLLLTLLSVAVLINAPFYVTHFSP